MKFKVLTLLGGLLVIAGCGNYEHTKLCKKDAGTVVYKQVNAEGFYHAQCGSSCWGQFLETYERTGLSFMEFYESRAYKWKEVTTNGYWRYFIAKKGHSLCNKKITEKLDSYSQPDEFTAEFRKTHCIASKKITEIEAKYSFENSKEVIDLGGIFSSKIVKVKSIILERHSGRILGETIEYSLNRVSGSRIDGGEQSCKVYANPATPYLYEKVIVSN